MHRDTRRVVEQEAARAAALKLGRPLPPRYNPEIFNSDLHTSSTSSSTSNYERKRAVSSSTSEHLTASGSSTHARRRRIAYLEGLAGIGLHHEAEVTRSSESTDDTRESSRTQRRLARDEKQFAHDYAQGEADAGAGGDTRKRGHSSSSSSSSSTPGKVSARRQDVQERRVAARFAKWRDAAVARAVAAANGESLPPKFYREPVRPSRDGHPTVDLNDHWWEE
jgi:hypothetical protein